MTRMRAVALLWAVMTIGFPVEGSNVFHSSTAFDPGPNETCNIRNDFYEPTEPGLIESCTDAYLTGSEDELECGKLVAQDLRLAASRKRAIDTLGLAALGWYRERHPELGGPAGSPPENLADLAVTGRTKFEDFRAHLPTVADVRAALVSRLELVAPLHVPNEDDLKFAASAAAERAYRVAWALRGPSSYRQAHRAELGWIAVSSEHDAPHRPVNVPATSYSQRDLRVNVPIAGGKWLQVMTRFSIAGVGIADAEQSFDPTRLPEEAPLKIPADAQVVLFLHGHSSRLEEQDSLTRALLTDAARRHEKLAVIAMDLPSNGYASPLEHTDVAAPALSSYPASFPLLNFLDQFVIAFVDELDRTTPFKDRILGVVGGSLGGNLALRLAEQRTDWVKNVAAWSPASSWPTWSGGGLIAREGVRITRDRMNGPEISTSRTDYFQQVFRGYGPLRVQAAQAERWFSPSFPCRSAYMMASLRDRQETYSPLYRRWHWRVAHEQLLFSHDDPGVFGPLPSYAYINARVLLAAGADDNLFPEYMYDCTQGLANHLPTQMGATLFIGVTGHSMHTERPALLAQTILDFTCPDTAVHPPLTLRRMGGGPVTIKAVLPAPSAIAATSIR